MPEIWHNNVVVSSDTALIDRLNSFYIRKRKWELSSKWYPEHLSLIILHSLVQGCVSVRVWVCVCMCVCVCVLLMLGNFLGLMAALPSIHWEVESLCYYTTRKMSINTFRVHVRNPWTQMETHGFRLSA